MKDSPATWKVWGNEFCLNSLMVDLRGYDILPETYRQLFALILEDWTGMPNRRDKMIAALSEVGNVVAITGDIHAFFADTPFVRADPSKSIVEFVTSSISSSVLRSEFLTKASSDPGLAAAGAPALAFGIQSLLQDPDTKPSPHLAYGNLTHHGFAIAEVDADAIKVVFYEIDGATDTENLYDAPDLAGKFETRSFKTLKDSNKLLHEVDGTWKTWDMTTASWK